MSLLSFFILLIIQEPCLFRLPWMKKIIPHGKGQCWMLLMQRTRRVLWMVQYPNPMINHHKFLPGANAIPWLSHGSLTPFLAASMRVLPMPRLQEKFGSTLRNASLKGMLRVSINSNANYLSFSKVISQSLLITLSLKLCTMSCRFMTRFQSALVELERLL